MVWGSVLLGFGVWGSGFGVWGLLGLLRFGGFFLGFFGVFWGLGFGFSGIWVCSSGFGGLGVGFLRDWGLGF